LTYKPGLNINGVLHISPQDALEWHQLGEARIMDIRESDEVAYESFDLENIISLPVSEFLEGLSNYDKDDGLIVVCAHGTRSVQVVNYLMQQGFKNVVNLDEGFSFNSLKNI